MVKRQITPITLERLLSEVMNRPVERVTPVGSGQSETHAFECDGREFIIRFAAERQGFDKDLYAFEHFGKSVPVPELLHTGSYEDGFYAISRKLPGNETVNPNGGLLDELIRTLDVIRALPVDPMAGFGWFDEHGIARYGTWQAWVTKPYIMVRKPGGDLYTWKEVLQLPFVDPAFIHRLLAQINQLLRYIPPGKHVIHGSFGWGNILTEAGQVTAVLNWNEAAYGDYLYDVAYLDFWSDDRAFIKSALTHYQKLGLTEPHVTQRIHCHQLFAGLTALGVNAALEHRDAYEKVVKRIEKKLIGKN